MRGRHDERESDTSESVDDEFDISTPGRTTAGFQRTRIFRANLVSWRDFFIEALRTADLAPAHRQYQANIGIGNLDRILRDCRELRTLQQRDGYHLIVLNRARKAP